MFFHFYITTLCFCDAILLLVLTAVNIVFFLIEFLYYIILATFQANLALLKERRYVHN